MSKKPFILVLNSTNPSRLSHLRKLSQLRDRFDFFLISDSRSDIGWQARFIPVARSANMLDLDSGFSSLVESVNALGRPDGVLNLSEFCVPLQVKLCDYYGLPGPSDEAARYGRNKALMRKLLLSLGMPIPRIVSVNRETLEAAKELKFPVIVKPTTGGGATMVRRCESFLELEKSVVEFELAALRSYGEVSLSGVEETLPLVVEEMIGGELLFESTLPYPIGEISVESVHFNGQTTVLAIHDKPIPSNGPHFEELVWSTPSRIPQVLARLAGEYVDRIHRRLGVSVLHTEFRTLKDALVPLEFGVRMGGACIYNSILYSTGNDFLEIQLSLCQGLTPEIKNEAPVPTLSHCLWSAGSGVIRRISGEIELTRSPFYVEHQLYDDVGAIVNRAPFSSRANGHVIYRSPLGFESLERELLERMAHFHIEVEEPRELESRRRGMG